MSYFPSIETFTSSFVKRFFALLCTRSKVFIKFNFINYLLCFFLLGGKQNFLLQLQSFISLVKNFVQCCSGYSTDLTFLIKEIIISHAKYPDRNRLRDFNFLYGRKSFHFHFIKTLFPNGYKHVISFYWVAEHSSSSISFFSPAKLNLDLLLNLYPKQDPCKIYTLHTFYSLQLANILPQYRMKRKVKV